MVLPSSRVKDVEFAANCVDVQVLDIDMAEVGHYESAMAGPYVRVEPVGTGDIWEHRGTS